MEMWVKKIEINCFPLPCSCAISLGFCIAYQTSQLMSASQRTRKIALNIAGLRMTSFTLSGCDDGVMLTIAIGDAVLISPFLIRN